MNDLITATVTHSDEMHLLIYYCYWSIGCYLFSDGKICLDVLQLPPSGSYSPAITLESILLSIQLLLASPNPDDPLRNDVSDEYRYNRELFNQNASKLSGSRKDITLKAEENTQEDSGADVKNVVKETPIDDREEEAQQPETSSVKSENQTLPKAGRKRKHDET